MSEFNSQPGSRSSSSSIDHGRLTELATHADELRKQGAADFLDQVLAGLDEAERSQYQQHLSDYLAKMPDATIVAPSPTGAEPDTIDSPVHLATEDVASGLTCPSSRPAESIQLSLASQQEARSLPKQIGNFLIEKELGRGAFGVVYLGFDQELQRKVAIKVSLVSDRKFQERLRVEASKLAQAESPGIVPVYHIGRTDEGNVYIVQKYIEGTTLRDVIREQPVSPLIGVSLIREIALGLAPAHAMEILHRDLKPDNVLIDMNGKAWIADFGLAISEQEQFERTRELAGTPPYMSPEQIQGRVDFLDPRSDIWALGVMFYELLTGKLPFYGKDRKSLTEQICELDPRPLQQRGPGVLTESMNQVFSRCCAKKPSDRFATVDELVEALEGLAREGLSDQNVLGQFTVATGKISSETGWNAASSSPMGPFGVTTRRYSASQSQGIFSVPSQRESPRRGAGRWLAAAALVLFAVSLAGYQVHSRFQTGSEANPRDPLRIDSGSAGELERLAISGARDPGRGQFSDDRQLSANKDRVGDGSKQTPWIVDPGDAGTHTTLAEAIAEASPGDFIRVMPGLYREQLVLTKPLTLDGAPPKAGVYPCVIENDQQSPLTIDCDQGSVVIRSFMISGKGHQLTNEFNPVELRAGGLRLESCALETRSQNCIKVRGDADLQVLACLFKDSSEFAISAKDFSQITITGSDFLCSGIEVTGGSGTVDSCKLFGKAGIAVANNLKPLQLVNCQFGGDQERSLLATDGGRLEVVGCQIDGVQTGVEVTDKPFTAESPIAGRPGEVLLRRTRLNDCLVALQVNGGKLEATEACFIDGGQIAIGVSTGQAELTGISISRIKEKAVVVYQGGDVSMSKSNISGCEQSAVKIIDGTFRFDAGAIEDFAQYGILVGEESGDAAHQASVYLNDVSIRAIDNKYAGLCVFRGRLEMHSVLLEGTSYGLYVNGETSGDSLDEPAAVVEAFTSRFLNQTGYSAVVLGDSQVQMDAGTHTSLNASKGIKAAAPAQVVVDGRES